MELRSEMAGHMFSVRALQINFTSFKLYLWSTHPSHMSYPALYPNNTRQTTGHGLNPASQY